METSAKWLIAIAGLLLLLPEHENPQRLSDLRKRRNRKLFYISQGKVIPSSEVNTAKRMTRAGYGKVYAVWAYNANEARDTIHKGKGELVQGLGLKEHPKYEIWQVKHSKTKFYVDPEPHTRANGTTWYKFINAKGESFEVPDLHNVIKVKSRLYPKPTQKNLFGLSDTDRL